VTVGERGTFLGDRYPFRGRGPAGPAGPRRAWAGARCPPVGIHSQPVQRGNRDRRDVTAAPVLVAAGQVTPSPVRAASGSTDELVAEGRYTFL
jgi:hypothetical protein